MADLAGGVVGAVSLGIQICKELVDYIDSAKNADERKAQIAKQMDTLTYLLDVLGPVLDNLHDSHTKTATQTGVQQSTDAIGKIRTRLESMSPKTGSKLGQQLGSLKSRLLFPFREGELLHYKSVVESVQENLKMALIVLQIEQGQHNANSTKSHFAQQSRLIERSSLSIINLQAYHQNSINLQLRDQAQLVRSELVLPIKQLSSVQTDVERTLSRLEAKIDSLTPRSFSPKSIEEDFAELNHVSRRIKKIQPRPKSKTWSGSTTCGCQLKSTTTVHLQWPIQLSRTVSKVHSSGCAYAAVEDAVTDLKVRFAVCSLSLRKKAEFAIALSSGAGTTFGLTPALRTYRVVDKRSPAFKLLASFDRRLGPNPGPHSWEKPAQDLHKLFVTRKASPYDRLPNGRTLLHYFCAKMEYTFLNNQANLDHNVYYMAKKLLGYMPREASERDDEGLSCIDHCFCIPRGRAELIQHFTEHGVSIAIGRHLQQMKWNLEWGGANIHTLDETLLDCSERMKAVILRSEDRLSKVLRDEEYASTSTEDGYSLYEMATLAGWSKGCEMIFQRGIKIAVVTSEQPLLQIAVEWKHLDVLRFWLRARATLDDADSLNFVGNLEDAFDCAVTIRERPELEAEILSALVNQRRQLKYLAATYLSEDYHCSAKERLLDTGAWKVFDALVDQGIDVNLSLRPSRPCVFHQRFPDTRGLAMLYEAGFRDTGASHVDLTSHTSISPLLFLLTSEKKMRGIMRISDWFLDKGATLEERWPNSKLTILHLIGWRLGYYWSEWISLSLDLPPPEYFTNTQCADNCHCACSSSGCFFITMACKGLGTLHGRDPVDQEGVEEEWRKIYRTRDKRLGVLAEWVAPATRKSENRWLVTEFTRLVIFSKLGLQHTCCDPKRIQHDHNPDFHISLKRTCDVSDHDSHDVGGEDKENDAYLLLLLEELIPELDEQYNGDIEELLYDELLPRLDYEIRRLKEEDLNQFANGRQQLGIIMEMDSSESEEDEVEAESDFESDCESEDGNDSIGRTTKDHIIISNRGLPTF